MTPPAADLRAVVNASLSGRFTLEEEVGRGGMGVVFAARDERHRRRVAVKVLGDASPASPAGAQRFLDEIRTTASLAHPNIVPLIDSGCAGSYLYYIMPLVEGESLAARLRRQGRLPVRHALRIGRDVAAALAHAHRQGVVHRDVKPANVLLASDGRATLSDFGIAHAVNRAVAEPLTRPGFVVGTPAYMSPEQAVGRAIDARADVYSLGVVLHEMLSGAPPEPGEQPGPLASVRADVSPELSAVVSRAVARNPDDRLRTAEELEEALEAVSRDYRPGEAAASYRAPAWGRGGLGRRGRASAGWLRSRGSTLLLGGVLAVAVGWALSQGRPASTESGNVASFPLEPPPGVAFTVGSWNVPAISPDGSRVVFMGTDSLGRSRPWVRSLSRIGAHPMETGRAALHPFWSPDGRSLGFFDSRSLWVAPATGGAEREIAASSSEPRGASWNEEGDILFAPGRAGALHLVTERGGPTREVTRVDRARGEIGHQWPHFLPDGERFVFFVASSEDSVRGIHLGRLSSPRIRRLVASDASGQYAAGHLLYLDGDDLVAHRLVGDTLSDGLPGVIATGIASTVGHRAAFSASARALVYGSLGGQIFTRLSVVDSTGRDVGALGSGRHQRNPTLSLDGRLLAVETYTPGGGNLEILDRVTGRTRLIGRHGEGAITPVWSPGGERIAFAAEEPGGWSIRVAYPDRTDAPETVLSVPTLVLPTSWSSDGRHLLLTWQEDGRVYDVYALALEPDAEPVPLVATAGNDTAGRFSPDGERFVYVSRGSGQAEVYMESFPPTGLRCQISTEGGYDPQWDPSGGRIYYLTPGGVMSAVDLDPAGACGSGARRLFDTGIRNPSASLTNYAVLPDSGGFIVNGELDDPATPPIGVILNWLARLG